MSFENIPLEMRQRVQWVTFDIEGNKKIPYVAGNCSKAASNKPSDWRTFEEAVEDVTTGRRQHIGYAFSSSDPFVFIDLDEEQPGIFEAFNSYSQRSVSGEGIHIICRGSFEGDGRHPKSPNIGLFQNARLCLMTGDVIDGRTTINTVDDDQLQSLHHWLTKNQTSSSTTSLVEIEPSAEDAEVFEKCKQRFDTFLDLWNGNAGPDHSESDHALISMLSDCTDSNEQVRRMFFSSALCRDHRRDDRYVNRSLKKTRAKQEELKESFLEFAAEETTPEENFNDIGDRSMIDSLPEGLIKRIADWHWRQSTYPFQECSVAVAISVLATVAGRNFQTITGSGLNPWLILLADTSWGKDEYPKGISAVFSTVSKANTFGHGFMSMISSSAASGEGLEDQLVRNSRLNCYLDEFDIIFKSITTPGTSPYMKSLEKLFLLLYGRSGKNGVLRRRLKARGKDEEDTPPVQAPCLVVSGETIPEKLYGHMSIEQASSGFLQRFSLLEAHKDSISTRMGPEHNMPMPQDLVEDLLDLFVECDHMLVAEEFRTVECTPEAKQMLADYAYQKRIESLNGKTQASKHIFNRSGLKVYKYSGLFGVSANFRNPLVTKEHVEWAIQMVDYNDQQLFERLDAGTVGTGQSKQENQIRDTLKMTTTAGIARRRSMGIAECVVKFRDVVPYGWLKRTMLASGAFSAEKNSVDAFERCLSHMVTAGEIMRVPKEAAEEKYGKGCGPMIGIIKL